MSTITIYPDTFPTSTSVDGTEDWFSADTWANVIAHAGNVAGTTSSPTGNGRIASVQSAGGSNYQAVTRAWFIFDRSSLGSNPTINSFTFSLWIVEVSSDQYTSSIDLVEAYSALNTVIVDGDFLKSQWPTMVAQATAKTFAGLTTGAMNDWSGNSTGNATIAANSIVKFATVLHADLTATAPGQQGGDPFSYVTAQFASNASGHKPALAIDYTAATNWTKTLTETLVFVDTINRLLSRILSDTTVFSDTLVTFRTAGTVLTIEAITLVASMTKTTGRVLSDSISLLDLIVRNSFKILSETVNLTVTFTKIQGKILSVTLALVDRITFLKNGVDILWTRIAETTGGIWSKIAKTAAEVWTKGEKPD